MIDLLERLAAKGVEQLSLSSAVEDDLVTVRITLQSRDCKGSNLGRSEMRFLRGRSP